MDHVGVRGDRKRSATCPERPRQIEVLPQRSATVASVEANVDERGAPDGDHPGAQHPDVHQALALAGAAPVHGLAIVPEGAPEEQLAYEAVRERGRLVIRDDR